MTLFSLRNGGLIRLNTGLILDLRIQLYIACILKIIERIALINVTQSLVR